MQDKQTAGLDLPLKVLAWEDADSAVWLTYDDLTWLARHHGLGEDSRAALAAMTTVMTTVATVVAGPYARDNDLSPGGPDTHPCIV